MASLFHQYSDIAQPKITQATGSPKTQTLAGLDHLLLILPEKISAKTWRKIPQGSGLQALMRRAKPGGVPAITTRLKNKRQTALHAAKLSTDKDCFELLSFARKMVASVTAEKAGVTGIWVLGFDQETQAALTSHLVAAALAAAFPMPAYKEKDAPPTIKSIRLIGLDQRVDLERVIAEADGNNLTRWLTAQPANKLDAISYTGFLKEMAGRQGWLFKKFGVSELRKMGAGAFLAVAQGNADDSAAIVRLRYRPDSRSASPALGLIGKGIIFDTGGTNLKPFTSMLDMHIDMGGSAVAVGTLLALSRMKFNAAIDCWLAITENRTGPTAYKSQDVITALNGKTIQTIHTDAEGRMALADTLVLASRDKPKLIIDYATLTGACLNAVTARYSGAFTNKSELHPVLKRTGRDSGERVWPFPIGKEFLEELKSDTADLQQCSPGGGGDHILAASFLAEFVENDTPWIHVDLSACQRKGGLAHVPTEITGFGVRFSTNLLVDKDLLQLNGNK
jgi:leucyl aminopeptidase